MRANGKRIEESKSEGEMCNKVRTTSSDPINNNMQAAQMAQNKMLRMLNGSSKKSILPQKV